ncbi:MAG: 5'/3'-nucleotidase SurE [Firmicutes bacterium]|nr:5'/3'-nucleotidase SurE [Bacillota bacterium]
MKILITNDDGINALGIKRLAKELKKIAEITIIAPDRERSASGHSITMHNPLRIEKSELYGENIDAWQINGTPSDCIKIGIESIMKEKPDLVVSGINNGPNLGTDVLYSGTVSAAIEGAIHDVPSVAISISGIDRKIDYEGAALYSCKLVKDILENYSENNMVFNINVPSLPPEEIKGIRPTELSNRRYNNTYEKRKDPMGRYYYWLSGELKQLENNDNTDIKAIEDKMISITPLHFDLTDYNLLNKMKKWKFINSKS